MGKKLPTKKELLDMCIYLRQMLDATTKLSKDTAFVLNTYIKMKDDEKALFREIDKLSSDNKKNEEVVNNIKSIIKGDSNE
tara:strand:+ start:2697 stop:2939 length:243 start_codon:yes stop_codon:yes gene_type:complete